MISDHITLNFGIEGQKVSYDLKAKSHCTILARIAKIFFFLLIVNNLPFLMFLMKISRVFFWIILNFYLKKKKKKHSPNWVGSSHGIYFCDQISGYRA